jgi:adenine phosphoribosyltransferase
MKIVKNILKNELNIRTEKDFPTKGIEFIDINPLILQKETLNEIIDLFANELKDKKVDYIVAPEARGFIFGTPVAYKLGCGCIPVRKKGKLPPSTVQASFDYEKEYGKDTLELPKLVHSRYKGKNFYIIDDIYATGNTINAIKDAIIKLGGNVLGEGVLINIVELNDNKELFSIIDVNEE